jgi:hypothetical protein
MRVSVEYSLNRDRVLVISKPHLPRNTPLFMALSEGVMSGLCNVGLFNLRIKDKAERWTLVPQSVQGSVIPLDHCV